MIKNDGSYDEDSFNQLLFDKSDIELSKLFDANWD
jgi:hypothetical protein